ncbi:MAG: hypothetical protein Q7S48_03260 [bacterium]|nr:hypothetical protein [bacterium]
MPINVDWARDIVSRIWDRVHNTVAVPFLIYFVFMIFVAPKTVSMREGIVFLMYALFIFWIVWLYALHERPAELSRTARYFYLFLLIFSMVFLVGSRLFPFFRYGEAPLGYDTGFYLKAMDEAAVAEGLTAQIHTFLWTPLLWLGIPKISVLHGVYFIVQLLIAGSLYALSRSLATASRLEYAASAIFLFSVSLVQFSAYWWMFYQTQMAIAFLLITLVFLYRRNVFAFITAGFGAATHTPTFFPFGIALGLFAILRFIWVRVKRIPVEWETKYIFALGIITPFFMFLLRGKAYIVQQLEYVVRYRFLVSNFPDYKIPEALGLFINFSVFRLLNIYLYPFAVLGLLLFLFRKVAPRGSQLYKRLFLMALFFLVLFVLSYSPVIYQHRFLIYLDLVLILFAVYPLMLFFRYFLNHKQGRIMIAVLLCGFVAFESLIISKQRPQVFPNELREIKAIALIAEPDAYSMATHPLYTPWVYAFSGRMLVAPGYLANLWRLDQWDEFWAGPDDIRRHELLRLYRKPLYIFIGSWLDENRGIQFLKRDPYLIQVSPHVWKYDTRGLSLDMIVMGLHDFSTPDQTVQEMQPVLEQIGEHER